MRTSNLFYRLPYYWACAFLAVLLTGCGGPNLVDRARDPWAFGCCGVILLILDIIAIVEVINSPWENGRKVLWILLILFFPILGLIIYYIFGRE